MRRTSRTIAGIAVGVLSGVAEPSDRAPDGDGGSARLRVAVEGLSAAPSPDSEKKDQPPQTR